MLTSQINTASQDATEYLTNNNLADMREGMDVGVQSNEGILDRTGNATPEITKIKVKETPRAIQEVE